MNILSTILLSALISVIVTPLTYWCMKYRLNYTSKEKKKYFMVILPFSFFMSLFIYYSTYLVEEEASIKRNLKANIEAVEATSKNDNVIFVDIKD